MRARGFPVILLLAAGSAAGQINCSISSVPPTVRSSGVTELVGDVIVKCRGGEVAPAGSTLPKLDFRISVNTNITSRLMPGDLTEAILLIDEPLPQAQTLCGSNAVPYTSPGICPGVKGSTGANVFQARQASPSTLIWQGVPFDPPGTRGERTLRLSNIRANAAQFDVQPGQSAAIVVSTSVILDGRPVLLNGSPTVVAQARNSLAFSVTGSRSCLQCEGANRDFFNNPNQSLSPASDDQNCDGQYLRLRYRELFPAVFRRRNQVLPPPGYVSTSPAPISQDNLNVTFSTESGFMKAAVTNQWPFAQIGLADHGTRLNARFTNIPAGTRIFVPRYVEEGTLRITAVTDSPPPTSYYEALSSLGGTAQAVWEVMNSDPETLESIDIPVVVAWSANQPELGTMSVQGAEGPDTSLMYIDNVPVLSSHPGKNPDSVALAREARIVIREKEHIPRFDDRTSGDPGLRGQALLTFVGCAVQNSIAPQLAVTRGAVPVVYRQQGNLPDPFQLYVLARGAAAPSAASETGKLARREAGSLTGIEVEPPSVPWITVESNGSVSPVTLNVRVNPSGLAPGEYSPTFRLRVNGFTAANVPVPVTVQPAGPHLTRWGVTNTASYESNLVAAGQALTLFGQRFGPDTLAVAGGGAFPTTLGETRVLFDGVAAPLLYAAKDQVSAIAPFSLEGKVNTLVQIEYRGERSTAVRIPVAPAVPGILTADASGFGQAAALNQDSSFNAVVGEAPGRFVIVYGVGGPATNPRGRDGEIATVPLPVFAGGPIKVFLDGIEAPASDIAYFGPAPGLVNGIWQLNLRLPLNARPNSKMLLRVQFGDFISQPGVFVSVR